MVNRMEGGDSDTFHAAGRSEAESAIAFMAQDDVSKILEINVDPTRPAKRVQDAAP